MMEDHPLYLQVVTLVDGRSGTVVDVYDRDHFEVDFGHYNETISRHDLDADAYLRSSVTNVARIKAAIASLPIDDGYRQVSSAEKTYLRSETQRIHAEFRALRDSRRVRMGEGAVRPASDFLTPEWIEEFAKTPYNPGYYEPDEPDTSDDGA